MPRTNAFPHHCVLAFEMRSQTIHNVVKCRSTHSEVVKEFSLIFSESPIKSIVGAFQCPCGYYRMHQKFSFFPLLASSPPEMKQTQKIKTPIPHGSHVDCSASLTKLTRLAGADSDFVGLCVRQIWVLLVGKTVSVPAPTPMLSVRVRPP